MILLKNPSFRGLAEKSVADVEALSKGDFRRTGVFQQNQRFDLSVKILVPQEPCVPKCLRIMGRVFGKVAKAGVFTQNQKLQHFLQEHLWHCGPPDRGRFDDLRAFARVLTAVQAVLKWIPNTAVLSLKQIHAFGGDLPILCFLVFDTFKLSKGRLTLGAR